MPVRSRLATLSMALPVLFMVSGIVHFAPNNATFNISRLNKPHNPHLATLFPDPAFAQRALHTFCNTDPGLDWFQTPHHHMSHKNCYGNCRHQNPNLATFLSHAIEAPRIASLCLLNPFHGFYDCVWPLIHYLSACAELQTHVETPFIITNNRVLSPKRRRKWVVQAQESFLQNTRSTTTTTIIERHRIPGHQCLCFRAVARFKKSAFWRPVRYTYIQKLPNKKTLIASHPVTMKENTLRHFRATLLSRFNLDTTPPPAHAPVLVYGRQDTTRRRWENVDDFVHLLQSKLPTNIPIRLLKKMPPFQEQITLFNQAALHIAPHGAAMVNTLFMREKSAVLEIASRHCLSSAHLRDTQNMADMDATANISDSNAWVPWHAQSLGLYHISAPCIQSKRSNFSTDNKSLVELALVLLMVPRQLRS